MPITLVAEKHRQQRQQVDTQRQYLRHHGRRHLVLVVAVVAAVGYGSLIYGYIC